MRDVQPGGGVVIRLELLWGYWRRWYLRTFRRGYVTRMQRLRRGTHNACPHEVLDPRDLKFYRNQGGYAWNADDDPFAWRDRLPFVRDGLAELILFSLLFFGLSAGAGWLASSGALRGAGQGLAWAVAVVSFVVGSLIVWFFRNPRRVIPAQPGLVVSPADGTIVTVEEIEHDEFAEGRAVLIGIFLSIFNVHINRAPVAGRVIGLRYRPGKCLNALRPESVRENEQLAIRMQGTGPAYRRMTVRQITGQIARRIVCGLKPGDVVSRGEQFGMIKLGSRTELVIPYEAGLDVQTHVGQKVRAGQTVLAEYCQESES
ncbi:MAG: phosphatidylserine decarboxylase family protein [Planctomycetaceae bacterium]